MFTVQKVTGKDLPETASHGFRLVDEERPQHTMFFHWHEEEGHARTAYSDVLAAIPDRLREMGYEDETTEILTKVTNQFGVGGK